MTEQQIRAAALREAARYYAGAWAGGFRARDTDVIETATLFAAYILEGKK